MSGTSLSGTSQPSTTASAPASKPCPVCEGARESRLTIIGQAHTQPCLECNGTGVVHPRTPEEVRQLVAAWESDPDWDLETSDGFGFHRDELREIQLAKQSAWQEERAHQRADREAAERTRIWAKAEALSLVADGNSVAGTVEAVSAALLIDRLDRIAAAIERVGDLIENGGTR